MNVPPEPASFSEDDAEMACESLPWQVASARAAVAKHHARLIDQLDGLAANSDDDDRESDRAP
ncbi:hypothetical protein [Brevundimonas sp. LjRoot202]|uniref:hypothetical protein n=1 Tax=Brevundimonas sp. LjRoot202 TaxID=3342281 RepID=UPI003ECF6D9C